MPNVFVSGAFDDIRSRDVRFLQEASKLGNLSVSIWPDETIVSVTGSLPKLSLCERYYFLGALRYIQRVLIAPPPQKPNELTRLNGTPVDIWVDREESDVPRNASIARADGIAYQIIPSAQMTGFPFPTPLNEDSGRKRVVVTGCYDWLHSGHVRFFEEVSAFGGVYAVLGHDANIRMLKGEGHPLLRQEERRYMVSSIRYVKETLISSGQGWLDADPEIKRLKPHIYAVNRDGDKGGKREYCQKLGIDYLVLERTPLPGLPARSSTELRGF